MTTVPRGAVRLWLVPATTSDVAIDAAGNFVVVWTGYDADRTGAFGRRDDADGQPVGPPLS